MTADEFLAWDRTQTMKHEFVRGEVFAMAGAHEAHVTAMGNIDNALRQHLRGSPCRTFLTGMKPRVEAADAAAYGWADWTPAMPDDQILRRLLALNRERAGKQHKSATLFSHASEAHRMSTTTIRLPDELKARIETLAAARGSSAHAFMVEAVARAAEQEERRLDFEAEAERRFKRMLRTGEYHSPEAVRTYAMALARGEKPAPPVPSKMTPDELKRLRASARRLGDG